MSNFTILSILFLAVFLTGTITFFFQDPISKVKKYINSFASAVVACLIFSHILPETYELGGANVGIFLLLGLVMQLILEAITGGIEHDHEHASNEDHIHGSSNKKIVIFGLLFGLCLHSVLEGLPMLAVNENHTEIVAHEDHQGHDHSDHSGHAHDSNHDEHGHEGHDHHDHEHLEVDAKNDHITTYIWAVVQHKVPVSIVLSLFLLSLGVKKRVFFGSLLIFAIASPIGAFFGSQLLQIEGFEYYSNYLVAFSTGMLMHIISGILYEHAHGTKAMVIQTLLLLAGIGFGLLIF